MKKRKWKYSEPQSGDKEIEISATVSVLVDHDDVDHRKSERLARQIASLPIYMHAADVILEIPPGKWRDPDRLLAHVKSLFARATLASGADA